MAYGLSVLGVFSYYTRVEMMALHEDTLLRSATIHGMIFIEHRVINGDRRPACRIANDRLEAYPTYKPVNH